MGWQTEEINEYKNSTDYIFITDDFNRYNIYLSVWTIIRDWVISKP